MRATTRDGSGLVAILGGCGRMGRAAAERILLGTKLSVALLGRDSTHLARVAGELYAAHEGRVCARVADAADRGLLASALRGADVAVICTTGSAHTETIAQAACLAETDCLDLRYPAEVVAEWRAIAPAIREHGRCCLMQAGHLPGLPSVLARHARQKFGRIQSLRIATAIRVSGGISVGAAREILREAAIRRPSVLQHGRIVESGLSGVRRIQFGLTWGSRSCFPLVLEEMQDIPDLDDTEESGVYIAGMNGVVTCTLLPLAGALGRVGLRTVPAFLGHAFAWAVDTFTGPPFGAIIRIEATGTGLDGCPLAFELSAHGDDSYRFAASVVTASLMQYLDGAIAVPGIRFAGHVLSPARLLDDMRKLGVQVTEKSVS